MTTASRLKKAVLEGVRLKNVIVTSQRQCTAFQLSGMLLLRSVLKYAF